MHAKNIGFPSTDAPFSLTHELTDVYSRLLMSFILLMMDAESFGSVLHHNNGVVMRMTQVGMYVMKIK